MWKCSAHEKFLEAAATEDKLAESNKRNSELLTDCSELLSQRNALEAQLKQMQLQLQSAATDTHTPQVQSSSPIICMEMIHWQFSAASAVNIPVSCHRLLDFYCNQFSTQAAYRTDQKVACTLRSHLGEKARAANCIKQIFVLMPSPGW